MQQRELTHHYMLGFRVYFLGLLPIFLVIGFVALQVMSLRPRFQAAAQQAQREGGSEDDVEAVKGMARLFAELGESYVGLLAQGVPGWEGHYIMSCLPDSPADHVQTGCIFTLSQLHRESREHTQLLHAVSLGAYSAPGSTLSSCMLLCSQHRHGHPWQHVLSD